ncbi:MAG: Bax inhibitor-1 family protein, partial [Burkholderiales bacterium]|nr:Bax inhibitor-1 family protein [Burkholderiales bacterium]
MTTRAKRSEIQGQPQSNGGALIGMAFGGTGAVFLGMSALASTIKTDLSNMGKWLFVGLIVVLVASVA